MRLNKHGQVWRKPIVLTFPTMSWNMIADISSWFVCSDLTHKYRELKDPVGILQVASKPINIK